MSKPAKTDKPTITITLADLRVGDRITRFGYLPNRSVRVVRSVAIADESDPKSWVRYSFTLEDRPDAEVFKGSGAPHVDLEIEVRS